MRTPVALDPAELSGRDNYKLLIGLIVPRPIAWVSTLSTAGHRNLAPFSFFNAVAGTPPSVMFAVISPDGRTKDTLTNVRATGEFTINVVGESVVAEMVHTSGEYDHGVDEFEVAGIEAAESETVAPPRVAAAMAAMECRLDRIVEVGHDPRPGSVVIGEILRFVVDESVLDGIRIDHDVLAAVGRMAGDGYSRTRDRFDLHRP